MPMSNKGLTKLLEELAEAAVEAAKLIAYPDGNHPDGRGDLFRRLEDEIADVRAACDFVEEKLGLNPYRGGQRTHRKFTMFLDWDKEEV